VPGLTALMKATRCAAVLHFAGSACVEASMWEPIGYFSNNVSGSLSLLHAMVDAGVMRLVFSSSAAVYGKAPALPILETDPILPISPYGLSKAMVEQMLYWFDQSYGVQSVSLRYFNAAGADPLGGLSEEHSPETHLIPRLLHAVATGQQITIHGNDYTTPDGTCIRDFVHVEDLAQAHSLALGYLLKGGKSYRFNVGTGTGHSIRQVISTVEEVTGRKVPYFFGYRREGDPPTLIASSEQIQSHLGWEPRYELHDMVEHAWRAKQMETAHTLT
jgi:UDP-glucose 4-epimerase